MVKPKATLADVLRRVLAAGHTIDEPVYVVGIRGYYKDSMGKPGVNDHGIYDDALFLVTPNGIHPFNGNTDPSRDKPNVGKIVPGKYRYKPGIHGLSKPKDQRYPAFRPATPDESVPVTRQGQKGISKGYAINIHKGGFTTTSSEGCQTVWPNQWLEFYNGTMAALRSEAMKEFWYYVIEE